ncbi:recombinase family protein [Sphingomonas sp. AP4-R1]|uniref:recombinase family protein n=1 Tax=Sphingomonas sp. AP4-R1 TaxID=2735134 RepID=UPI0014934408|nr:recombinase family protein [Sphingomonas sp. AP4-R1]QJU59996.1 recombinase family protein [Sphingomonas sp. AP4-R1]
MRKAASVARVRAAIYTRKSTEDGLEQDYNSLDAQYDACAAYILSQRQECWTLVPNRYDDGGFSGGNMERPGLQRLLADVAAGRVDTIVIYKVDRLTRSLSDFAKIVEVLDDAKASFVSVTQAFNTTTSMGRLTLNMLLSFAQFEREVTGERIRDKIAASKRKGLWMGGPVPLGYDVQDRKLVVNEAEASLVRHIFERYLTVRSVSELAAELNRDGYRTKIQNRASGPHRGGCPFRRGTLYHLLANRIYRGDIVHKGDAHPGEHPAIIDEPLWNAVQAKLAERGPGAISKTQQERTSHLLGLLHDGLGRPMTSTHTSKGSRRYRYYVSRDASAEQPAWRTSAHDLEQLVRDRVRALLLDRNRIARMVIRVDPARMESAVRAAIQAADDARLLSRLKEFGVAAIDLEEARISIRIDESALLGALGIEASAEAAEFLTLDAPIQRVRRGHELRLVIASADAPPPTQTMRDEKLVGLLAEAQEALALVLASPGQSLMAIASGAGRCRKRLTKLLRIAWLAPDITTAIVKGVAPANLTTALLLDRELASGWADQRRQLGLL